MPSQTNHTPPLMLPLTMTVTEACAAVDSWSTEQQFGIHTIARVLRAEVARKERKMPPIKYEFNPIYLMVRNELESALAKFPPFNSAHEGWAIIKEELDELWEVVRLNQSTAERNEKLRKECVQVAAMAMRFLLEMNHFKN